MCMSNYVLNNNGVINVGRSTDIFVKISSNVFIGCLSVVECTTQEGCYSPPGIADAYVLPMLLSFFKYIQLYSPESKHTRHKNIQK